MTYADLNTAVREIADALGAGWTAEPAPEHRAAYLDGPDSARVCVMVDWQKPERFIVSGEIPTPYARRRYDYKRAEITVSRSKGAAKIARDITTRLMPAYLPKLSASLEDEARHAGYVGNVAEIAEGLEAVALGALRPSPYRTTETRRVYSVNLADGFGTVSVGGSSVTLELNGISPALAGRILETIVSA